MIAAAVSEKVTANTLSSVIPLSLQSAIVRNMSPPTLAKTYITKSSIPAMKAERSAFTAMSFVYWFPPKPRKNTVTEVVRYMRHNVITMESEASAKDSSMTIVQRPPMIIAPSEVTGENSEQCSFICFQSIAVQVRFSGLL